MKAGDKVKYVNHVVSHDEDSEVRSYLDSLIEVLDKFKEKFPDTKIIVETSKGTVDLKIGEALIYEGMGGELVIDSE